MQRLALGLWLVVALAPLAAAQDAARLFNGRDLTGWKTEHARARVRDGAIRVEPSRGWVRTAQPYADYVLTFEMRMGAGGGKAGVFVRGWPVFDRDSRPANAFRLTRTFPTSVGPDAPWERWEIECVGQRLEFRVNGEPAYSVDTLANPQGYVALWSDGTAEFRAVEIRRIDPVAGDKSGAATYKTPGAAIPRLLKEVKPAYTRAAMEQRIEGTVWIAAVVEVDGSVGTVSITQSLDPQYGLDESAIAAVKQWQFTPATVNGEPARMLITIELKFTLK